MHMSQVGRLFLSFVTLDFDAVSAYCIFLLPCVTF
jgi:hypothetical protein